MLNINNVWQLHKPNPFKSVIIIIIAVADSVLSLSLSSLSCWSERNALHWIEVKSRTSKYTRRRVQRMSRCFPSTELSSLKLYHEQNAHWLNVYILTVSCMSCACIHNTERKRHIVSKYISVPAGGNTKFPISISSEWKWYATSNNVRALTAKSIIQQIFVNAIVRFVCVSQACTGFPLKMRRSTSTELVVLLLLLLPLLPAKAWLCYRFHIQCFPLVVVVRAFGVPSYFDGPLARSLTHSLSFSACQVSQWIRSTWIFSLFYTIAG